MNQDEADGISLDFRAWLDGRFPGDCLDYGKGKPFWDRTWKGPSPQPFSMTVTPRRDGVWVDTNPTLDVKTGPYRNLKELKGFFLQYRIRSEEHTSREECMCRCGFP